MVSYLWHYDRVYIRVRVGGRVRKLVRMVRIRVNKLGNVLCLQKSPQR